MPYQRYINILIIFVIKILSENDYPLEFIFDNVNKRHWKILIFRERNGIMVRPNPWKFSQGE